MTPATITLIGASGGHGTTTVATALAILAAEHMPTLLVSADATALLSLPANSPDGTPVHVTEHLTVAPPGGRAPGKAEVAVVDAGPLRSVTRDVEASIAVLRGPCYLGLRQLVTRAARPPAGVILLSEPGRSLTRRDVEDVVGAPVVATIGQHPAVARTIDAGLMLARLHRLPQLRELGSLARRLFDLPDGSQSQAVA